MSENKFVDIFTKLLAKHPHWGAAKHVIQTLQQQGYEALIAGGAVRDILMDKTPGDLDIATSAKPDEVEKLFPRTVAVGKAFGVIRVLEKNAEIEVATYRKDLNYEDGRRPTAVEFTSRQEDAKRRDFTVNALFYDPIAQKFYDDVGGRDDLDNEILRAVGNPAERFNEDELRRLRLIRFKAQLGFKVETQTDQAVKKNIEGLKKVSRERITEELQKMWKSPSLKAGFDYLQETGAAAIIDSNWNSKTPKLFHTILQNETLADRWIHYFSFFFDEPSDKIKTAFQNYRLPKEIEKQIETAHQAYAYAENYAQKSKGEQRILWNHKGALLGLRYALHLKDLKPEIQSKLKIILTEQETAGPLPEPLVKAAHFQDKLKGAELGAKLKEAYLLQLDQNLTEVDEVLAKLKV